jgi:type I restriction enzyme S subunit
MKEGYRLLGDFIQPVDERNRDLKVDYLLGVSISKQFIPSIANIVGTDLSSYKIVRTGQFAYGPVTSRNGEKISIALLRDKDCIISSSYTVFEVVNKNALDPEYLMLWFSRPEFDRYARYMSHGSVREIFDWDELCKVELPVPSIDKQRSIVKAYQTITERIELKRRINDNLEATAMSLYKSWFIDYEPFDLDDEGLPVGWCKEKLNDKLSTSTQSINPQKMDCDFVWHYSIPAYDNEKLPSKDTPSSILSNKYIVPQNAILVSKLNPDTKRIWRSVPCFENAICSTEFIVFSTKEPTHRAFYYLLFNTGSFIDFLVSNATGSTNSRMRVKPASSLDFEFICPPNEVIDSFCRKVEPLLQKIEENHLEIRKLKELIPIAVAKMMSSSR